jgi:lipooligosaccharide transport system permease protein
VTFPALHVVHRNALVYRRVWRGSLFFSFLQPMLFLLSMGVGLGALVNRGDPSILGGIPFLHFLAPGLLAGACMQTASVESSYPITGKMMWHRNYEAISATPMRIADIVIGEVTWIGIRITMVAVAFTLVITAFGVPRSPMALLAIPAAVLTGLAFSAPIMAFAATVKNSGHFHSLFRFVITPLFLFSGTFFPIERLPATFQTLAWCTPLFHGVSLVRGLTLNTLDSTDWIVHVLYLVVMLIVGLLAALITFRRKLWA